MLPSKNGLSANRACCPALQNPTFLSGGGEASPRRTGLAALISSQVSSQGRPWRGRPCGLARLVVLAARAGLLQAPAAAGGVAGSGFLPNVRSACSARTAMAERGHPPIPAQLAFEWHRRGRIAFFLCCGSAAATAAVAAHFVRCPRCEPWTGEGEGATLHTFVLSLALRCLGTQVVDR